MVWEPFQSIISSPIKASTVRDTYSLFKSISCTRAHSSVKTIALDTRYKWCTQICDIVSALAWLYFVQFVLNDVVKPKKIVRMHCIRAWSLHSFQWKLFGFSWFGNEIAKMLLWFRDNFSAFFMNILGIPKKNNEAIVIIALYVVPVQCHREQTLERYWGNRNHWLYETKTRQIKMKQITKKEQRMLLCKKCASWNRSGDAHTT